MSRILSSQLITICTFADLAVTIASRRPATIELGNCTISSSNNVIESTCPTQRELILERAIKELGERLDRLEPSPLPPSPPPCTPGRRTFAFNPQDNIVEHFFNPVSSGACGSLTVTMWGAGGGATSQYCGTGGGRAGSGGAGGFAQAMIPLQALRVFVGRPGLGRSYSTGAGGGNMSAVAVAGAGSGPDAWLVIAGGGGGGAGSFHQFQSGSGGAGGGVSGNDGTSANGRTGGKGGTQTSGGAAGSGASSSRGVAQIATAGQFLQGGEATGDHYTAGWGGQGFYGGGAGGPGAQPSTPGAGGGGGSGKVPDGGILVAGSATEPARADSPLYQTGVGVGAISPGSCNHASLPNGVDGGPGLVVLQWG